jgi:hypothetical protein
VTEAPSDSPLGDLRVALAARAGVEFHFARAREGEVRVSVDVTGGDQEPSRVEDRRRFRFGVASQHLGGPADRGDFSSRAGHGGVLDQNRAIEIRPQERPVTLGRGDELGGRDDKKVASQRRPFLIDPGGITYRWEWGACACAPRRAP